MCTAGQCLKCARFIVPFIAKKLEQGNLSLYSFLYVAITITTVCINHLDHHIIRIIKTLNQDSLTILFFHWHISIKIFTDHCCYKHYTWCMVYFTAIPSCTLQPVWGILKQQTHSTWYGLRMQLCICEGRTTACTKWGCHVEVCHEFYWQRHTMQHQLKIPSTDSFCYHLVLLFVTATNYNC